MQAGYVRSVVTKRVVCIMIYIRNSERLALTVSAFKSARPDMSPDSEEKYVFLIASIGQIVHSKQVRQSDARGAKS